jgi:hypothetical protein
MLESVKRRLKRRGMPGAEMFETGCGIRDTLHLPNSKREPKSQWMLYNIRTVLSIHLIVF